MLFVDFGVISVILALASGGSLELCNFLVEIDFRSVAIGVVVGPQLSVFMVLCAISLFCDALAVLNDDGLEASWRCSGLANTVTRAAFWRVDRQSDEVFDISFIDLRLVSFKVLLGRKTIVRQLCLRSSGSKWKPSSSVIRCLWSNDRAL